MGEKFTKKTKINGIRKPIKLTRNIYTRLNVCAQLQKERGGLLKLKKWTILS